MIVVNLWFIKHSNGLFHYGMDYAEALGPDVRQVWVRDDAMARLVSARLPEIPVRILDAMSLVRAAVACVRRGDQLFTPSSHPIAFVPRQTVVVHDSFPFEGRVGRIKSLLFRIGLYTSCGVAAYINRADGYLYLARHGIPPARTRYLPNRIGEACAPAMGMATIGERIVIGLFGSDSAKKNYDALFAQVRSVVPAVAVQWRIFGHENDYTRRLKQDYPSCDITVVGSDAMSLDQFVDTIDFAVSAALGEGFARPVALALMRGVPTMLLDTPVFREFYGTSTRLYPTVAALVDAVAGLETGDRIARPTLAIEDDLRADFAAGIAWLRRRR